MRLTMRTVCILAESLLRRGQSPVGHLSFVSLFSSTLWLWLTPDLLSLPPKRAGDASVDRSEVRSVWLEACTTVPFDTIAAHTEPPPPPRSRARLTPTHSHLASPSPCITRILSNPAGLESGKLRSRGCEGTKYDRAGLLLVEGRPRHRHSVFPFPLPSSSPCGCIAAPRIWRVRPGIHAMGRR